MFLLSLLPSQNLPQCLRLHVVLLCDLELDARGRASPNLMVAEFSRRFGTRLQSGRKTGRWIIRQCSVIAIDGHETITLIRVVRNKRPVDRNLLVIHAEAVTLAIRIGEQSGL